MGKEVCRAALQKPQFLEIRGLSRIAQTPFNHL